ncbi:hypothetical protein [Paracoccus pacificus]|uniref:Uncharacterized protein n=1 Tax=Paracoccus pacificus TaxID=1463598 RepID=A0ABW4RCD7_9RHOB
MAEIVDELGGMAARNVIGMALEQLATAITDVRLAHAGGNRAAVVDRTTQLSRLAWQVGLVSLASVAQDVAICAECGDEVGYAATLARLLRVANASLTEIWDGTMAEDDGA